MFSTLLNKAAHICSSAADKIDQISINEAPKAIAAVKQSTNAALNEAMKMATTANAKIQSDEFKAKAAELSEKVFGGIGKVAGAVAKTAVKVSSTPATDIKKGFIQSYSK